MPVRAILVLAGLLTVTACSSATTGRGSGSRPPSSSASHDFPSAGRTGPTGATSPINTTPATATSSRRTTHPVPSTPLRSTTVHGEHGTYVVKTWARVHTATCVDHAYGGAVIAYLTAHPCTGLDRILATTVVHGRAVGLAQSTVAFEGVAPRVYETAGRFKTLVTKDGTGNLADLLRSRYRLPSGPNRVPSPDAFSALNQDSGVTIVDAWYLEGSTPENDPALVAMANDIYLQV